MAEGAARTEGVGSAAREFAEDARKGAEKLAREARTAVEREAQTRKEEAVEQISTVATAFRHTAEELRGNDQAMVAQLAEYAADEVERLAEVVRDRSLGDIASDVESFARRQPAMFMGGAVLGGLVLGRFLRSSQRRAEMEAHASSPPAGRGRRSATTYSASTTG